MPLGVEFFANFRRDGLDFVFAKRLQKLLLGEFQAFDQALGAFAQIVVEATTGEAKLPAPASADALDNIPRCQDTKLMSSTNIIPASCTS